MTTMSSIDKFSTHRAIVVGPCGTRHPVLVRRVNTARLDGGWWVTSYDARFDAQTGVGFEDGPKLDLDSIEERE